MCGIAGYIGTSTIDDDQIQTCLHRMRRRGPDHASSYHHCARPNSHVYLLHSRLNIIDLNDRSNQPFRLGSKALVYNGELYNYIELKEKLRQRDLGLGQKFSTTGDTEVLLRVLLEDGWEGLDKCEGMWAFACYDEEEGTLLLSRDRFGEKPLYLYEDETGITFGSEIKFITALLGRRLSIDYDHLYRYMVNGYKALYKVRQTFFKGIRELAPASVLSIDIDGSKTERKYWNPTYAIDESLTWEESLERVREAMIRSVKLRLRADVPLAFCMSGGIDSNTLISIDKRVFDYDVQGFTIVNKDERYDEWDMVEHSIEALGIRHHSVPMKTEGFLPRLRTLIRQHDAPIYTISYFSHWMLMESIADQGYRISISGTAADEFFTGYYDHHNAYLYEARNDPKLYAESLANWERHIKPIVRNPFLGNPEVFIENSNFRGHIFLNADEFSAYLRKSWLEPFTESRYREGLLRNRMLNELFHEATPVILHEDDLNAMYYSIENRSPFLDRNLFELCNLIPTKYLIQNGKAKALLRESMRGIVPDKILDNRRKVGFNAPIFDYLDVHDPAVRNYLLDDSPIYEHVRREKISAMIEKPNLPNSESKFLFYFLNSKMFLEEFAD